MTEFGHLNTYEITLVAGCLKCKAIDLIKCYGQCDLDYHSLVDWDQYDGDESPWIQICREQCAEQHC